MSSLETLITPLTRSHAVPEVRLEGIPGLEYPPLRPEPPQSSPVRHRHGLLHDLDVGYCPHPRGSPPSASSTAVPPPSSLYGPQQKASNVAMTGGPLRFGESNSVGLSDKRCVGSGGFHWLVVLSNRQANVMANALSAGFHLMVQRALPPPVGSRDLVTRYRHFRAAFSFGKCPLAFTALR